MERLILIVDDAVAVADVLRTAILETARTMADLPPLAVETVQTGEELLERCATQHPHLIILDVNLADLDGIDCFYRLRERSPELARRTIFLTGYAGSEDTASRLAAALADGARAVLRKPVGMADIEKLLERYLR